MDEKFRTEVRLYALIVFLSNCALGLP
jgi:hypothetical protein